MSKKGNIGTPSSCPACGFKWGPRDVHCPQCVVDHIKIIDKIRKKVENMQEVYCGNYLESVEDYIDAVEFLDWLDSEFGEKDEK